MNYPIIEEIVKTYELSEDLTEKMIRIADRRLNELFISSFDETYTYIAQLIEKFQFPLKQSQILRLDYPITPNSETTFHNIISMDHNTSIQTSEEDIYDSNKGFITIKEAIVILKEEIDGPRWRFILHLLDNDINFENSLNVTPDEFLSSIPKIKERLEILVKNYSQKKTFIIPKRPLISINLDPSISVKFGRRDYHKNPLEFFRKHSKIYQGLTRNELSEFDLGLYCALKRYKQLDKAIPLKKEYRGYTDSLSYFQANKSKYEGMNRSQLRIYDSGLYKSLKKKGLLHKAIPEKWGSNYRGYFSGLECYLTHLKGYEGLGRWELFNVDQGLYRKMLREGSIGVIPRSPISKPKSLSLEIP